MNSNLNLSSKQQQQRNLDQQPQQADLKSDKLAGAQWGAKQQTEAARDFQADAAQNQLADKTAQAQLGAQQQAGAQLGAQKGLSQAQASQGISRSQAWNQASLAKTQAQDAQCDKTASLACAQDQALEGQQAKAGIQTLAQNIGQLAQGQQAQAAQGKQATAAQFGQQAGIQQQATAAKQQSWAAQEQCAKDPACAQKMQDACAKDPACAQKLQDACAKDASCAKDTACSQKQAGQAKAQNLDAAKSKY